MSPLSSFKSENFDQLKLQKKFFLKNVATTKISDLTKCDHFLSSRSTCEVDYDVEQLHFTLNAFKDQWTLKKFKILHNGNLTNAKDYPDGLNSNWLTTIELDFSIAHLQILFFNQKENTFLFYLEYEEAGKKGENFEAIFTISLPSYYTHHELDFNRHLIGFFHPPKNIELFFRSNFETDTSSNEIKTINLEFAGFRKIKNLTGRFEKYGYREMFGRMLSIEDLAIQKALDDLAMTDKQVYHASGRNLFRVIFEGKNLSEKLEFNQLVLTPMSMFIETASSNMQDMEMSQFWCRIKKVVGSTVIFEQPKRMRIDLNVRYKVELKANRMPIRMALESLDRIRKIQLETYFTTFDEKLLSQPEKIELAEIVEELKPCNPAIKPNSSQQTAVKNIVNRKSFPAPYVIFGPPGTGKTSTIVEAISQIVKLQPSARILVTANSNAACDEIGERLLGFISRYKMYRLYSPSFDILFPERNARIHPKLKPISNIRNNLNKFPSYEEFHSYNVVISTLVNCGRMITSGIGSSHFNFIFVDECASTIEPLSMIPIAFLGAEMKKVTAQIVLAGDHMQLQGMVHAFFNEKHGFGISLLERVMSLDRYQYPFDSSYVTQLTDNFRSHWAILKFSNNRFYNSILQAKQVKEIADFAIGWDELPNKNFPLLFHSVLAPSEMDGTSLYNNDEIRVVEMYVKKLLDYGIEGKSVKAADIGVICPYGAQRRRLQERLRYIPDLDIGSVDAFQGREKLIIILSTVRSQTTTVGFLKNEKRLNVAITRAKALLIVIGNGQTLQKNKLWYKFLNFCHQHDALIGEKFMLRYRKVAEKLEIPPVRSEVPEITIEDPTEADVTDDGSDESISDAESDVSWTYEDFRIKARTAKFIKPDIASEDSEDNESLEEKPSELDINGNVIEPNVSLADALKIFQASKIENEKVIQELVAFFNEQI